MTTETAPEGIQHERPWSNLGTRTVKPLRNVGFPDAGAAVRGQTHHRPDDAVDVLLVNPPSPDGGIWIRTQHRVGRRSREEMVWPQCSLAQLAAMLYPDYSFHVVDAIAERMSWGEFERVLRAKSPLYYLTQCTAPTLTNDMYGVMLAKSLGALTMAFGTHVTPMPLETMRDYPALDFVLRGEPELTFRELIDVLEGRQDDRPEWVQRMLETTDPLWAPVLGATSTNGAAARTLNGNARGGAAPSVTVPVAPAAPVNAPSATSGPSVPGASSAPVNAPSGASNARSAPADVASTAQRAPSAPVNAPSAASNANSAPVNAPSTARRASSAPLTAQRAVAAAAVSLDLGQLKGLVWRRSGEVVINLDRPFIADLDDLPLPLHHVLPLDKYRMPLMKGPFTFVLTSRGCPAGCKYCIKHVSYQWSVRLHSPQRIMKELWLLHDLGITNIHMYADLFTVNRDQVVELCQLIIAEGLKIRWTCNSRVDYVDEEMLRLMGRAGCWLISWGIESGSELILKKAAKGADPKKAHQALAWARQAGIRNWGYFIIGLPGETLTTIRETIDLSKALPLDIALFHIAAPYPGTPFFFEVVENGWFRAGTRWEEVDMDKGTVLQYDNLSAEDLMYWQRRAFREWAFRRGPAVTYLKMLVSDVRTFRRAVRVGLEHLGWAVG